MRKARTLVRTLVIGPLLRLWQMLVTGPANATVMGRNGNQFLRLQFRQGIAQLDPWYVKGCPIARSYRPGQRVHVPLLHRNLIVVGKSSAFDGLAGETLLVTWPTLPFRLLPIIYKLKGRAYRG